MPRFAGVMFINRLKEPSALNSISGPRSILKCSERTIVKVIPAVSIKLRVVNIVSCNMSLRWETI